jgi:hypothetical protein
VVQIRHDLRQLVDERLEAATHEARIFEKRKSFM